MSKHANSPYKGLQSKPGLNRGTFLLWDESTIHASLHTQHFYSKCHCHFMCTRSHNRHHRNYYYSHKENVNRGAPSLSVSYSRRASLNVTLRHRTVHNMIMRIGDEFTQNSDTLVAAAGMHFITFTSENWQWCPVLLFLLSRHPITH